MSNIKLTPYLRSYIVKVLVAHGGLYTTESQARRAYEQAGHNLYNAVFTDMLPIASDINKMFLRYGSSFDLDFGRYINDDPTIKAILMGRTYLSVSVPTGCPRPVHPLTVEELGMTPDTTEVQNLLQAYRAWTIAADNSQRAYDRVALAISRFDTVESLFDTWTELVPILAPLMPQPVDDTVSGDSISTLNDLLCLGKEQNNGS